jgi:DNA-binding transcriptional LysR family regulator
MYWNDRIGRRLKLKDLHYLLTVVEAGSMAKAAPLLMVSQPVLSKAIADLELTLGVRLLDRGPHGVEPTVYGRQVLASCHVIFDELRQGVKEVEYLCDPSAGELSVGSNEASTIGIVPDALVHLRMDHPRAVVQVVPANTAPEQQRALRERRIDFAIGRISDPVASEEFETEVLYHQRFVILAGGHNPWAHRSRVELRELMSEPWILPSLDTSSGQFSADVFRNCGLPVPRAAVVTSSFQLNRGLLEGGPFVSLLPASILPSMIQHSSLRIIPVDLPALIGPVGIIKLRNRALSPLAMKFLDYARTIAREMQATKRT